MSENDIMAKTQELIMEAFGYPKRPIQNPQTYHDMGEEI